MKFKGGQLKRVKLGAYKEGVYKRGNQLFAYKKGPQLFAYKKGQTVAPIQERGFS